MEIYVDFIRLKNEDFEHLYERSDEELKEIEKSWYDEISLTVRNMNEEKASAFYNKDTLTRSYIMFSMIRDIMIEKGIEVPKRNDVEELVIEGLNVFYI